jgi:hypothetical protein
MIKGSKYIIARLTESVEETSIRLCGIAMEIIGHHSISDHGREETVGCLV